MGKLGRKFYMHLCLTCLHFCLQKQHSLGHLCLWGKVVLGSNTGPGGVLSPTGLRAVCLGTLLPRHVVSSCGPLCVRTAQKSHHRGLEGLVLHCAVEPVKLHLVYPRAQISWWIHPALQHVHILLRIRFMFLNFWKKNLKTNWVEQLIWINGNQLY